jgi:hypothetical protein
LVLQAHAINYIEFTAFSLSFRVSDLTGIKYPKWLYDKNSTRIAKVPETWGLITAGVTTPEGI